MINEGSSTPSEATNLINNTLNTLKKPSMTCIADNAIYSSNSDDGFGFIQIHSGFIISTRNQPYQYRGMYDFIWMQNSEDKGYCEMAMKPMKPYKNIQPDPLTPKTCYETFYETDETDETYSAPSKTLIEALFIGFIGFITGFIQGFCTKSYFTVQNLKVSLVSYLFSNVSEVK